MNTKSILYIVGGITVAVIALRVVAQYMNVAGADTSGVTSTTKGDVKTTPIKTAAFAAPANPLKLLTNSAKNIVSNAAKVATASKQFVPGANSYSVPYNNVASAKAAAASKVRVDYTPSAYAMLKPR